MKDREESRYRRMNRGAVWLVFDVRDHYAANALITESIRCTGHSLETDDDCIQLVWYGILGTIYFRRLMKKRYGIPSTYRLFNFRRWPDGGQPDVKMNFKP